MRIVLGLVSSLQQCFNGRNTNQQDRLSVMPTTGHVHNGIVKIAALKIPWTTTGARRVSV